MIFLAGPPGSGKGTLGARLAVFHAADAGHDALATVWYPDRLVVRVDAERDPAAVEQLVRTALHALGPQHAALPIYAQLPNFHAIPSEAPERPGRSAQQDAFITGRLGDGDRALMQVALEVGRASGAMVELEEYVGEWTLRADIARAEHAEPPFALADLIAAAREAGLDNGGWFLFANDTQWAYRSNEFADGELAAARDRLAAQARSLRAVLAARGLASAVGSSLERVHGIWRF